VSKERLAEKNDLEMVWKEAALAFLMAVPRYLNVVPSVWRPGLLEKTRTHELPNTNQEWKPLDRDRRWHDLMASVLMVVIQVSTT